MHSESLFCFLKYFAHLYLLRSFAIILTDTFDPVSTNILESILLRAYTMLSFFAFLKAISGVKYVRDNVQLRLRAELSLNFISVYREEPTAGDARQRIVDSFPDE